MGGELVESFWLRFVERPWATESWRFAPSAGRVVAHACESSQRLQPSRCGLDVKACAIRVNVFLRSVPVSREREVRRLKPLTTFAL